MHKRSLCHIRAYSIITLRGESYFKADIAAGRVGAEQTPPQREFD